MYTFSCNVKYYVKCVYMKYVPNTLNKGDNSMPENFFFKTIVSY